MGCHFLEALALSCERTPFADSPALRDMRPSSLTLNRDPTSKVPLADATPKPHTPNPKPLTLHPERCQVSLSDAIEAKFARRIDNFKAVRASVRDATLQGYLAHKKLHPPQDLRRALAIGLL